MKRPKPRDYGLNSDHAPLSSASVSGLSADPAQPPTPEEVEWAIGMLIAERVLSKRLSNYARALDEFNYNNGGR